MSTDARLRFLKLEREPVARRGKGVAEGPEGLPLPKSVHPSTRLLGIAKRILLGEAFLGLLGPPGFSTTQLGSAAWAPERTPGMI